MKHFYSQLGEDILIYFNFINKYCKDGIFLEVGGFDGLTFSNTLFFEKTLGFSGILIEPTNNFYKMKRVRKDCINVHKAIWYNDEEEVDLVGDSATAGLHETMSDSFMKFHHSNTNKINKIIGTRMDTLLCKNNIKYIDLLSVDVEGGELIVLETMDWTIPVYCVVIELDNHNAEKDEKCRQLLRTKGFKLYGKVFINEFWINENYFRKDQLFDPSLVSRNFSDLSELGIFHFFHIDQVDILSNHLKSVMKPIHFSNIS